MERGYWIGMALAVAGALLWGLSGTAVQFLGSGRHMNLEWLVTVRLLLAGALTVLYAYVRSGSDVFRIFRSPRDMMKLIIFGLLGLAMCQYTYFRSIMIAGVGIATVLQYIAPAMIIMYLFLRHAVRPSAGESVSVILALVGTVCIVFQNGFSVDGFNGDVLFWGLLSATGVAVYSLEPIELLKEYGTIPVVGFGMLLSGAVTAILFRPPASEAVWDYMTWTAVFTVIVLGTVVSFNAYMEGVRRIGAVQGSILSSLEPISAALFGWGLLDNQFTLTGLIGMALIISTVIIIGYDRKRRIKAEVLAKLNKIEIS